jgi:phospholipid/cholesterol/gamma-HCH transport system permease protein
MRYPSEILRQTAILIRGSTLYVATISLFFGMTVMIFAYFFLRSAAATNYMGEFAGLTGPRLTIPLGFGWAFASKVGGGLVAEIGAMRINEELDALESTGVSSMEYVVVTKMIGALLFVLLAAAAALVAATAGSALASLTILHALDPVTFWHDLWQAQNLWDSVTATVSMAAMAVTIVVVACFYGYGAKGGPEGVGAAVARSLVVNLTLVFFISAVFVSVFYGTTPALPFGG